MKATSSWKVRFKTRHPFFGIHSLVHFGIFLLITGAFYPLWRESQGIEINLLEGDPFQRSLLLGGYMVAGLPLVFSLQRVVNILTQAPLIWLLVGNVLLSVVWSEVPYLTLRRSVALLLTTIYGLTLVEQFSPKKLLHFLGFLLWFVIASSLVLILVLPEWGTMFYQGKTAWRGVFIHKNQLGIYASISLLVFGTLMIKYAGFPRIFWAGCFILAGVMLLNTLSSTAVILSLYLLLSAGLIWIVRKTRRDLQLVFPIFIIVLGICIIFGALNLGLIFDLLGRDITLTGRVPLWKFLFEIGIQRPWLGYGYGAFWQGWMGPSTLVWQYFNWLPKHSHNGFIDVWLGLGTVGLGLTIVFLLWLLFVALRYFRRSGEDGAFWLIFVGFTILLNTTESVLLLQNNFFWVLIVYISLSFARGQSLWKEVRV